MSTGKISENLASNKLFAGVSSETISILNDPKNLIELKEGTLIYSTGQPSEYVYLLLRGEVKLKHSIQKRLIFKFKDDYFGEQEVLEKTNRKTSAVANSDCLLLKISSALFMDLISKSKELKTNLVGSDGKDDSALKNENNEIRSNFNFNGETKKFVLGDLLDTNKNAESLPTQEPELSEESLLQSDSIDEQQNFGDTTPDPIDPILQDENNSNLSETLDEEIKGSNKNEIDSPIEVMEVLNTPEDNSEETDLNQNGWEKYQNILQPSDDIKRVAKSIVDLFLKETDSEIGAFYFYNADENRLEDFYQTHESFYKTKRPLKDGITNLAAKQKKIIYATHYTNHANYHEEIDHPNEFEGNTLIVVPLFNSEQDLIGIVQIGSNQMDFNKADEKRLDNAASYCAAVLAKSLSSVKIQDESEISPKQLDDTKLIAKLILDDVKKPLQNIRHYTSILNRFNLTDEMKKVIALISAQSSSTIDVLQSLIDYSEGNYKTEAEITNFNDAINQTLILLSDFVESRKVKLFKKLNSDSLLNLDSRKFYVACYFITKFACNLMHNGGKLYYSSSSDESKVELIIKDESNSKEFGNLHSALESYYFTLKNEQTVFGLAIPKFLIEAMNGILILETTDSGVMYKITFPRAFS